MGSLTSSSWRSGSLTFVSPQNHQPSVRPLTTNQPRLTLPSRSKMAKIGSIFLVILVSLVVLGIVLGDTISPSDSGRPKPRSKSSLLRKRKVNGSSLQRLRAEETTTPSTLEDMGTNLPVLSEHGGVLIGGNSETEEVGTGTTEQVVTTKPPKSKKNSRSYISHERPPQDPSTPIPEGCGECDVTTCKNIQENSCAAGLVPDQCSCCFVCGIGEGNRCFNSSVPNLAYSLADVGVCGKGLVCLLRSDLDPTEPREALCECRDKRLVCGNDKQTYSSECKIKEAIHTNPGLAIAGWGPCVSAPWMPTSVENTTVAEGEDVSLSCEVKGFPSSVIHWEFSPDDSTKPPAILPGDDSSIVVTVRGGPEQTMSTSWIQIIAVTSRRQGTYYCVARNSEGVTRSAATVTIHNSGYLSSSFSEN